MRSCGLKIEDVVMKIGDFVTKYKMLRGRHADGYDDAAHKVCMQGERNLINHFLVDENW
jgi:hypothetical protein